MVSTRKSVREVQGARSDSSSSVITESCRLRTWDAAAAHAAAAAAVIAAAAAVIAAAAAVAVMFTAMQDSPFGYAPHSNPVGGWGGACMCMYFLLVEWEYPSVWYREVTHRLPEGL
jgi:hypothetical protein